MAQPRTQVQNPGMPRGGTGESTQYEKNLRPRPLIRTETDRPFLPEVKPNPRIDDTKFEGLLLGVVEKYKGTEHVDGGKPNSVEYGAGDIVETNGRHARYLLADSPGCFIRLPSREVWNAQVAAAFYATLIDWQKRGLGIPTYEQFKADLESRKVALATPAKKEK